MSRRFHMRRNTRGGVAAASDSAPTIESIFGDSLVEYWDAALGITLSGGDVDSWTGQHAALAVPYLTARPTYTEANALFGDQPTVNSSATGPKVLAQTSGVDTAMPGLTVGCDPYIAVIARNATAATNVALVAVENSGSQNLIRAGYGTNAQVSTVMRTVTTGQTIMTITATPNQATAFLLEGWTLSGTHYTAHNGGTPGTIASVGGLSAVASRLGIGAKAGGSEPGDFEIAGIVVGVGVTAGMRTAFLAYCQARWGTP